MIMSDVVSRLLVCLALVLTHAAAWCHTSTTSATRRHPRQSTITRLHATNKKRGSSAAALKGFGSPLKTSVPTDKSPTTRSFLQYLDDHGAGDNLKRTGLGLFPLTKDTSLRGIVALTDIKKGDDIINIPYHLAINLGPQGGDPTIPAGQLLRDYCECHGTEREPLAYYKMLPEYQGSDCLGSTDFYSDAALDALQSPMIVDETLQRRTLTRLRYNQTIANDSNFPSWIDGTPVTADHLAWAVWIITSRVLTVQGDASSEQTYRLLIPYLDMCNHDGSSPHVLTGRACEGGQLKIVAGAPIKAVSSVNIQYGVAGNDRFIQDYGFLDAQGFRVVAQQLLGKMRIREGPYLNKFLPDAERERTLARLRETTMAQDETLLQETTDSQMRLAIEYRWRLKQALAEFMEL